MPIMMGDQSPAAGQAPLPPSLPCWRLQALVVASSDLSHFHDY